jgi:hydroxymethylpyrimidine/phosphomethylpyrimidine kinase
MTTEDKINSPYALTIASSDSSGGAGIQADLKTMTRFGVYGGSVIVGVTAQNTQGVDSTFILPAEEIRSQFNSVMTDIEIDAIKLGMLATREAITVIDDCLQQYSGPVVVDPVMVATSGDQLLAPGAVDAYTDLFNHATVVTPNAEETETLTGIWPDSPSACTRAAEQFFEWGASAILFKGGHLHSGDGTTTDVLISDTDQTVYETEHIETTRTHGSGCTLASAVAANLAKNESLQTSVSRGISFIHESLATAAEVGANGSVNHLIEEWGAESVSDVSHTIE